MTLKPSLRVRMTSTCLRTGFSSFLLCLGLHIVVMIAGVHISKEIFANDILTALKPSLKHDRKGQVNSADPEDIADFTKVRKSEVRKMNFNKSPRNLRSAE